MRIYNDVFFNNRKSYSLKAARIIVPEIIKIFNPDSVVDIGCGDGVWLSIFKNNGVSEILGVDGDYLSLNDLCIDIKNFMSYDLNKPLILKKFNLAVCLEVAEHLDYLSSDIIVETLTNLSDNIVFSAAIPGQGGTGHINEQPHSFWVDKFIDYGYKVSDHLRVKFMEDKRVPFWYRQNILVFTKQKYDILGMPGNVNFEVPDWDKEDYFE